VSYEYWDGFDRLEQEIAELEERLERTQPRWRWGVRVAIAHKREMLEGQRAGRHYVLPRREGDSNYEKRCVCGLYMSDVRGDRRFLEAPGHL